MGISRYGVVMIRIQKFCTVSYLAREADACSFMNCGKETSCIVCGKFRHGQNESLVNSKMAIKSLNETSHIVACDILGYDDGKFVRDLPQAITRFSDSINKRIKKSNYLVRYDERIFYVVANRCDRLEPIIAQFLSLLN
uniref:Uncharacterized protein n=1 Tax=Rhizophagus irregularis (strain DAOM 181602 / DAOM 197198 / MUCL 43194) TaxID=747089 RepID=U9TNI9_RHIID